MLMMLVTTFVGIIGACAWAVAPYIYCSPPTAGLGVRSCHRFGCKALSCSCAAWRPVRRIWLGMQARLVFDRARARHEAPGLLELAAKDLGQPLQSHAEQLFKASGSRDVNDAGNHLCRHHWCVRVGSRAIYLLQSSNRRIGGAQLP